MARKSAYPFKLSLLGVPEQVNIPIQLCQEQGIFSKYGVEVDYKTVPEGTGAMLKKLHQNEADLAITVTDGFIAGQAAGFNVQLVGTYVDTPLTWAISAHPNCPHKNIEEMFQKQEKIKVGISRLQSGSHTMSYYMADLLSRQDNSIEEVAGSQAWQKNQPQFRELGSFANLREGIAEKDIDIFLWEVFTTKPFFDNGVLKYVRIRMIHLPVNARYFKFPNMFRLVRCPLHGLLFPLSPRTVATSYLVMTTGPQICTEIASFQLLLKVLHFSSRTSWSLKRHCVRVIPVSGRKFSWTVRLFVMIVCRS
jgi:hypothetical protein